MPVKNSGRSRFVEHFENPYYNFCCEQLSSVEKKKALIAKEGKNQLRKLNQSF